MMTLLFMIFFHIVDDYYLQGVLAKMKQRKWWEDNWSDNMYKYDWLVALIMHSFSWTFMIMLPIAYQIGFSFNLWFICLFALNLVVHAVVDHLKANELSINLVTDQIIHIGQIIITYIASVIWMML